MMKNFLQRLFVPALLLLSAHAYCQVPKFSSYPAAAPTIFLDFDGQTVQSPAWQSNQPFICSPSGLNNAQISEIFNRVSEDYRPFGVNITTDSVVYFAAPVAQRVRIIITATSGFQPGVGGSTYVNCFTWGMEIPGFVFSDRLLYNTKNIAECCTHESGHAVGLSHQARYDGNCNLLEEYNTGTGSGQTGWAPVMGNSYGRNMTGWSDGPTPYDCTTLQDNLTILTTQNGFTYRTDDYPEAMNATAANMNTVSFSLPGIISTQTDKDAFKLILLARSTYHFDVSPYSVGTANDGADLDIMLSLYNGLGMLIKTYNPIDAMNVTIDTTLNAGTYYFVIAGAGNNNTTNYGSLGSYIFSGAKGALPIHAVTLAGANDKNLHKLSWNIIADEPIAAQVLESSTNGVDFRPLFTTNGASKSYSYAPAKSGTYYYRIKATSVIDQSMYSNIIALKAEGNDKLFTVSTFVHQDITITAAESCNYNLYDGNARLLASGRMQKGTGTVNTQNLPKGMYIIQMMSDNYKQTERIIKQ